MRRLLQITLPLLAVAACSSDNGGSGGTGPGNTPATPYSVSADSSFLNRTAPIGTPLATTVHVELSGQPSANVTVSWFVAAGSGATSAKTSTTDTNGNASITWTLSDTARVNTLTATAGSGSVNITATSTPGPASAISPATADSTLLVAGASTLLGVRVVDAFGNSVSGIQVSWSTNGGTLSAPNSTTGSTGNANVVFITSVNPATYSVTAAAAGLSPISFKVVGF
jgi:hypothetical protein